MHKAPSPVLLKIKELLMKRYAVEKILNVKTILGLAGMAVFSLAVFIGVWLLFPLKEDWQVPVLSTAILIMALIWWWAWKKVGKFIPKFVLIGMLGWILIVTNFFPGLYNSKSDGGKNFSLPIYRFLSLELTRENVQDKHLALEPLQYIDLFMAPGVCVKKYLVDNSIEDTKIWGVDHRYFRVVLYFLLLMSLILLGDLLLTVSSYMDKRFGARYLGFFAIPGRQRELDVKRKLIILGTLLILLTLITTNYFFLLWGLSFISATFLFRWEILERGQNHKPLSRSLLFVILTQVFSSIWGEILFVLLIPLSNLFEKSNDNILLYVIILFWTVILGSSVTVLIGIVSQVIWSGRRMTEKMKS